MRKGPWIAVSGGACALAAVVLAFAVPAKAQGDWWRPPPGTTWQWQLSGTIDQSFDAEMYDIDLFEIPAATIAQLQGDGRIVICYFSAGSWERGRPDSGQFPKQVLGKRLDGFPDERWLDIRQRQTLAPIMKARLDLAVSKGCDGVEPDNVDGYRNKRRLAPLLLLVVPAPDSAMACAARPSLRR